jgi:hypothetical protein
MRRALEVARKSTVAWPIFIFWVASVLALAGAADHWFTWIQAAIVLLGVALLLIASSILHYSIKTYSMVNGSRDELVHEVGRLRCAVDRLEGRRNAHT